MAFPTNPSPGDSYTDEYGTVWVYAGTVNGWYRQSVSTNNDTTYTTGGGSGSATAAGAPGQIQFTDGTNLAASADLTWDDTAKELGVGGETDLTALPWVDRRVRRWEPEPLRWLGVTAMYGLLTAADRHETGHEGRASRLARLGTWLTGRS